MQQFDYIISGAGLSGLSLAYHGVQAGLTDKQILLVDRAPKTQNDRTWCFWEAGAGPFDATVFRSWDKIWFHGERISKCFPITPYRYKMIRGIDFYTSLQEWVRQQPNITCLYGAVQGVEETPSGAIVRVDGKPYHAHWVFNSIYTPPPKRPGYHYWLQHFKGWVVQTPQPCFDTTAATFMDFRVEQYDEVRFGYILPLDAHTALVEYTLFSPQLLKPEEYNAGIREYLHRILKLDTYTVQHEEFGIIPMIDAPFVIRPSPHVMNIGTAGGQTKASTGYTFQRIQKQSRRIIESLLATGQPFYKMPQISRHKWMDSVLLHVLDTGREQGKRVFSDLFRNNPIHRVFRFLDEETMLFEDMILMTTIDIPSFAVSALNMTMQRIQQAVVAPTTTYQ